MRLGILGRSIQPAAHRPSGLCAGGVGAARAREGGVRARRRGAPPRAARTTRARRRGSRWSSWRSPDDDRFTTSRIEIEREGPSYTSDTLEQLLEQAPDDELFLILGGDQAAALPTWHEPEKVLELASVAVFERMSWGRNAIVIKIGRMRGVERVRYLDMPLIQVSSSAIRRRVREGGRSGTWFPTRWSTTSRRTSCTAAGTEGGGGQMSAADLTQDSAALAERIAAIASDKKAIDIRVIDLRGIVSYTDFFVIASGNTERQAKAIHDGIYEELKTTARAPAAAPHRGRPRGPLDPARLLGRRGPHLHARGPRVLPPRKPLGRSTRPLGRADLIPSGRRANIRSCCRRTKRAGSPRPRSPRRQRARIPVLRPSSSTPATTSRSRSARGILRVQCKWGALDEDGRGRQGSPPDSWLTPAGYVRDVYAQDEIDLSLCTAPKLDRCYLLRVRWCGGRIDLPAAYAAKERPACLSQPCC